MDVDTLTKDNLILKVNGEEATAQIEPMVETSPDGSSLARMVVLKKSIAENDEVSLQIKACVKNYAEKTMTSNYSKSALPVIQLEKVAMVTSNVQNGRVSSNTPVTLSCDTEEARIFYTTDGSTPDINSTLYTTPILVTGQLTIKAIAVKPGMKDSSVSTFNYTVDSSVTPKPLPHGGGGGAIPASNISLQKTENGSISITPQAPKPGDTVKLSPAPEQGEKTPSMRRWWRRKI